MPRSGSSTSWKPARPGSTRAGRITIAILDDGDVEHPNLRIAGVRDRDEPRDSAVATFSSTRTAGTAPRSNSIRARRFFAFRSTTTSSTISTAPVVRCCRRGRQGLGYLRGGAKGAHSSGQDFSRRWHGDRSADRHQCHSICRALRRYRVLLVGGAERPRYGSRARGARRGRRGKGSPIFFSTGNENTHVDYPASSPHAIAVGAVDLQGEESPLFQPRPHGFNRGAIGRRDHQALARSTSGDDLTTDLSYPRRGFNVGSAEAGGPDGLHYNKFSGTSSSTPFAAGVAALVLSANSRLTSARCAPCCRRRPIRSGRKAATRRAATATNSAMGG